MSTRFAFAVLATSLCVAAQVPLGDRADLALRASTVRAHVGEAIDVSVRLRIEPRLWREQLIQLFRQQTDLAVRVATPWAKAIDGFEALAPLPAPAGVPTATATAIVDGVVARVRRLDDETRDGVTLACFALSCRLVGRRAGFFTLPAAELRFSWAARFVEDFIGERVPEGRQDVTVTSDPLRLEVVELPDAGRPANFTGVVGDVAVTATIDGPASVRVGDALVLRMVVGGTGDLAPFRAPTLAGLPGFVVRGVREESEPGRRSALYELVAARAGTQTLPRLEVACFVPARARYEIAASALLVVEVAPMADGTTTLPGFVAPNDASEAGPRATQPTAAPAAAGLLPGVDVPFGALPVARASSREPRPDFAVPPTPGLPAIVAWLAAPWLLFVLACVVRHRARTRPQRLVERRRRAALRTFGRALATAGSDRQRALVAFLAQALRCPEAAVVGPGLPQRLCGVGVEPGLATRVDALLDALDAPRFGGTQEAPDDAALLAVATEVDRAVRGCERRARGGALVVASVLLASLGTAHAQASVPSGDDLPTQARRLLDTGDAARAFATFRRALDEGQHDAAALCFDLAVCAHRLGRPGEAALWYERTLVQRPLHVEARANLRLLRQELGLEGREPRTLLATAIVGLSERVAALGPQPLLAAGAVSHFAGLCGLFLAARRRRALGGVLLVLGLAFGVTGATLAIAGRGERAIVLVAGTRVLQEPHERAATAGALLPGARIAVLESSPRWARVRSGEVVGWVDARAFTKVALH